MMMNTIDVVPDHKQNFDENKPAQWKRAKNKPKKKQNLINYHNNSGKTQIISKKKKKKPPITGMMSWNHMS